MEIKPIRTEEDYEIALEEIDALIDADPESPEADKLGVLSILVEEYEAKHYPIDLPDPIEAIEYHMERLNLTRRDLEQYIGGASRVSEILNRKRPLNLRMIRNLHRGLGISLEVLFQEYKSENPDFDSDFLSIITGIQNIEFSSAHSTEKTYPKAYRQSSNVLAVNNTDKPDLTTSSSDFYSNLLDRIANAHNATERIVQ